MHVHCIPLKSDLYIFKIVGERESSEYIILLRLMSETFKTEVTLFLKNKLLFLFCDA